MALGGVDPACRLINSRAIITELPAAW